MEKISKAIVEFDIDNIKNLVNQALEAGIPALDIVTKGMAKGMEIVGKKYEEKEYFLAELIMAGEVMKTGMEVLEPHLKATPVGRKGVVVIGTVKGDLHDIGKNIVITLLKSSGFEVHDLGVDVDAQRFVEKVKETNADILALSALLTTTMVEMENVIKALKEASIRDKVKVIVGGAPITEEFASKIGADAFAVDRRHGGHTHIYFLALDPQADPSILRQAFLGDIHVGHHLDARDNRRLEPLQLRRHRGLVQHAVYPIANPQLGFHGLEMDVGSTILIGFPDDLVDELYYRSFLIQLLQIFGTYFFFWRDLDTAVFHDALDGVGTDTVESLGRLGNLFGSAQHKADTQAGGQSQGFRQTLSEGIVSCYLEGPVLGGYRHDVELKDYAGGEFFQNLLINGKIGQPQVLHTGGRGQGAEEFFFSGESQFHHCIGKGDSLFPLMAKNILYLRRVEKTATFENAGQAVSGRSCIHPSVTGSSRFKIRPPFFLVNQGALIAFAAPGVFRRPAAVCLPRRRRVCRG